MIKQIKRTEPKPHSWPAKKFYKHQQAIRNKSFTREIEPRIQLAMACIRPEVLNFNSAPLIVSPYPPNFLAATRTGPSFWTSLTSCPPDLSNPYPLLSSPHRVFQGTALLCLPGNHHHPGLPHPPEQFNAIPLLITNEMLGKRLQQWTKQKSFCVHGNMV